jgi:hypothetical protein
MSTRARSIVDAGIVLQQFATLCERRNQATSLKAATYTSIQIGLLRVELKGYYHISDVLLTQIEQGTHIELTDDTTPD